MGAHLGGQAAWAGWSLVCVHMSTCASPFTGLSSYTPKHSVAFSKWQEQALEQAPREAEPPPTEAMVSCRGGERFGESDAWASPCVHILFSHFQLTPASQNDLSDFRSEPALYF